MISSLFSGNACRQTESFPRNKKGDKKSERKEEACFFHKQRRKPANAWCCKSNVTKKAGITEELICDLQPAPPLLEEHYAIPEPFQRREISQTLLAAGSLLMFYILLISCRHAYQRFR